MAAKVDPVTGKPVSTGGRDYLEPWEISLAGGGIGVNPLWRGPIPAAAGTGTVNPASLTGTLAKDVLPVKDQSIDVPRGAGTPLGGTPEGYRAVNLFDAPEDPAARAAWLATQGVTLPPATAPKLTSIGMDVGKGPVLGKVPLATSTLPTDIGTTKPAVGLTLPPEAAVKAAPGAPLGVPPGLPAEKGERILTEAEVRANFSRGFVPSPRMQARYLQLYPDLGSDFFANPHYPEPPPTPPVTPPPVEPPVVPGTDTTVPPTEPPPGTLGALGAPPGTAGSLDSVIASLLNPTDFAEVQRKSAELGAMRGVGGSPAAEVTGYRMTDEERLRRQALGADILTQQQTAADRTRSLDLEEERIKADIALGNRTAENQERLAEIQAERLQLERDELALRRRMWESEESRKPVGGGEDLDALINDLNEGMFVWG